MHYNEEYRRFLNRLGYYNYQEGLIYRHIGQENGWDSHLRNCRNFILKAVEILKPARISVLGSGWLLDFPLAEVSEMNIIVTLLDIVHPPEVVKQVASLKNIQIAEADITGGLLNEIWKNSKRIPIFRKLNSLEDINIPRFRFADDPGLVVSLNILSQLDVLPVKYLRKISRAGENEFNNFRSEIQRKHIELLSEHKSVIITDIEEIYHGRSGDLSTVKSVIADLPEGQYREEWTWDFDLKRSDFYRKRSVMRVQAIML